MDGLDVAIKKKREQKAWDRRNRYTFGPGNLGKDMIYTMISMFLIYYLTDIVRVPTAEFLTISGFILVARVFDAFTDPMMGFVVDNTRGRWGKYKPWIVIGAITSSIFTLLLFSDLGGSGPLFVILFCLIYLMWGITYTANDISYWSMMPSMSFDPKEREKIGSVARIWANLGVFFVVVGIIPISNAISNRVTGEPAQGVGFFGFAAVTVVFTVVSISVTLIGVREKQIVAGHKETTLKDMVYVIFHNDQLLFVAIATTLFMTGYVTSTNFGLYYFTYVYRDQSQYAVFALVLGVSQILALAFFPFFSKKATRKTLYTIATALVVVGYIGFFFSPMGTMLFISISGILLFIGQAMIQLLMLMFLADCVDYGHLKLGKRNDSVTFSLSSFINKLAGAFASGIVSIVVVVSGIKDAAAEGTTEISPAGELMLKTGMMIIPFLFILTGYLIYRAKYKLDEGTHAEILEELKQRGDLVWGMKEPR